MNNTLKRFILISIILTFFTTFFVMCGGPTPGTDITVTVKANASAQSVKVYYGDTEAATTTEVTATTAWSTTVDGVYTVASGKFVKVAYTLLTGKEISAAGTGFKLVTSSSSSIVSTAALTANTTVNPTIGDATLPKAKLSTLKVYDTKGTAAETDDTELTLSPTFNSDTLSYTAPSGTTTKVRVDWTATDQANMTTTATLNGTAYVRNTETTLVYGANNFSVEVSGTNMEKSTYALAVTKATDANTPKLSALVAKEGTATLTLTPTFSADTFSYSLPDTLATSITVTPTPDANSNIESVIVGSVNCTNTSGTYSCTLNVGNNTISVNLVNKTDNTKKSSYTVSITRNSNVAPKLSALSVKKTDTNGAEILSGFLASTYTYTKSVEDTVTAVYVSATAETGATATIKNEAGTVVGTAGNATSGSITLGTAGTTTTFTIEVSKTGVTEKSTYTVEIQRSLPSTALKLTTLKVQQTNASGATILQPTSANLASVIEYSDETTDSTISAIYVSATAETGATATIKDGTSTIGTAGNSTSGTITLGNTGTSKNFTIEVSKTGSTTITYTVNILRILPKANVNLSALVVANTDINYSDSSDPSHTQGSFSAEVENNMANIKVTATAVEASNVNLELYSGSTKLVDLTSGTASADQSLALGLNAYTVKVIDKNDATNTRIYYIDVTKKANVTVSNIALSPALGFTFNASTYDYNLTAASTDASVGVTVTSASTSGNKIIINGVNATSGTATSVTLNPGLNAIEIKVQDNVVTENFVVYYIIITKATGANDPKLSALSIKDNTNADVTLTPAFAADKYLYDGNVSNTITSVTITLTGTNTDSILVNNSTYSSPKTVTLADGYNDITIIARKGTVSPYTDTTYVVTITKAPQVELSDLVVTNQTLSPAFSSDTTAYTVDLNSGTTSAELVPTAAEGLTIAVKKGTDWATGTDVTATSGKYNVTGLATGVNPVIVRVTNFTVTKDYNVSLRVKVTINNPTVALLNGLTDADIALTADTDDTGTPTIIEYKKVDIDPVTVTKLKVKASVTNPTDVQLSYSVFGGGYSNIDNNVASSAFDYITAGIVLVQVTDKVISANNKVYAITVSAPLSNNADLSGIAVASANLAGFNANTTSYTYDSVTDSVNIAPIYGSTPTRTVKMFEGTTDATPANITTALNSGNAVTSNSPISVTIGATIGNKKYVKIEVTAEDGTTKKNYVLTLNRVSDVLTLTLGQWKKVTVSTTGSAGSVNCEATTTAGDYILFAEDNDEKLVNGAAATGAGKITMSGTYTLAQESIYESPMDYRKVFTATAGTLTVNVEASVSGDIWLLLAKKITAPTNFTATGDATGIALAYDAVTGATAYGIVRSDTSFASASNVTFITPTGATHHDDVVSGTRYYKVRAFTADSASDWSTEQSGTVVSAKNWGPATPADISTNATSSYYVNAVYANSNMYVAYADNIDGNVYVKKSANGTTFTDVTSYTKTGWISYVRMKNNGNNIYVLYADGVTLKCAKIDASTDTSTDISTGLTAATGSLSDLSLSVNSSNVYVAASNGTTLFTRVYNGTAWTAFDKTMGSSYVAVSGESGLAYILYKNGSTGLFVDKWDNATTPTAWTAVGTGRIDGTQTNMIAAHQIDLAVVSASEVYAAYTTGTSEVNVAKFTTAWADNVLAKSGNYTAAKYIDLEVSGTDLYVSMQNEDFSTYAPVVFKYTTAWAKVGGSAASPDQTTSTSIAIDSGNVYLAYRLKNSTAANCKLRFVSYK